MEHLRAEGADLEEILAYVGAVEIAEPAPERVHRGFVAPRNDDSEALAHVVGANLVSFVAGIPGDLRDAVVSIALLAQLAADKTVPEREQTSDWYGAYLNALAKMGWTIQESSASLHQKTGTGFEAHRVILSVATALLGATHVAALQVVESTLNALKSLSKKPWIRIFQRESQQARSSHFQVSVAEALPDAGVSLTLMSFELTGCATLSQVLFAKLVQDDVTFWHATSRLCIPGSLLRAIGPAVSSRVATHALSYVAEIEV